MDASISRTQYQFVLENPNATAFQTWVPKLVQRLEQSPDLANVASDLSQQGLTVNLVIDRSTAARFGITPATVDNALYDLFGQRIISTIYTQSNQYRVIMEATPDLQQSLASLNSDSTCLRRWPRTARCRCRAIVHVEQQSGPLQISHLGQFPATTISFDIAPGASLGAAVADDPPGGEGYRPAGQLHHGVPGRGRRAGEVAVERTAAGAGGDRHRLHRAGRAVRELHPPDHDTFHAAVGRRRRAGGAADRR